jgi:hypothetical protein
MCPETFGMVAVSNTFNRNLFNNFRDEIFRQTDEFYEKNQYAYFTGA